jgi:hypothetical protein
MKKPKNAKVHVPKVHPPKHPRFRATADKGKVGTGRTKTVKPVGEKKGKARGKVGGTLAMADKNTHVPTTGGWGRKKSGGKRKKKTASDVALAMSRIH